jgi:hypothetical protein
LSSVIVATNNNLQSQINTLGGTTLTNYQTQINTISSVIVATKNNLQTQINTISSVIVVSNNNLQSQISALGGNTYQTQINTISSVIKIVASNTTFPSLTVNGIATLNGDTTINGNTTITTSLDTTQANLYFCKASNQVGNLFRYVPWANMPNHMFPSVLGVDWNTGDDTSNGPVLFNNTYTSNYMYSIVGNTVYLQFVYSHTTASNATNASYKYFFKIPDETVYVPQNMSYLSYLDNYNLPSGNVIGNGSFYLANFSYQGIFNVYMAQTANHLAIALYSPTFYKTMGHDFGGFELAFRTIYSFQCSYQIQPTGNTLGYA